MNWVSLQFLVSLSNFDYEKKNYIIFVHTMYSIYNTTYESNWEVTDTGTHISENNWDMTVLIEWKLSYSPYLVIKGDMKRKWCKIQNAIYNDLPVSCWRKIRMIFVFHRSWLCTSTVFFELLCTCISFLKSTEVKNEL